MNQVRTVTLADTSGSLIQNSQNCESESLQLKLDELIRATQGAHLALLDIEELTDVELDRLRAHYEKLAQDARERLRKGEPDTGTPEIADGVPGGSG